jgi:hypothetical protein
MPDPRLFSYDGLRALLEHARSCSRVLPLGDWDGGPALILRHDVDLATGPARRVAELERECGVRSSFFFLVSSSMYNPLAPAARRDLRALVEMGFEVGLHFDPSVHPADDLTAAVHAEARALELASGAPVRSISLHNPSVTGRYPLFEGFYNAYDERIFGPDVYRSDSRMRLTWDEASAFVARAAEQPVQLLLHPLHYAPVERGYREVFREHVVGLLGAMHASWQVNEVYAAEVTGLVDLLREPTERGSGSDDT